MPWRGEHTIDRNIMSLIFELALKSFLNTFRHIFMGLTACGQYMISHRVVCNDNTSLNHYSFNVGYKYTYVSS